MNDQLSDQCSNIEQQDEDAQKLLKDFEHLAEEVEERLQAIENTERELDRWRDEQLQKNRHFWDEYRRQVENFSACRIRTVQYEYTIKQSKSDKIIQRLKRAKFIADNLQHFGDQLKDLLQPSIIEMIMSERFQIFFSNEEQNNSNTTFDQRKEFLQQLEQLSALDQISFSPNHFDAQPIE